MSLQRFICQPRTDKEWNSSSSELSSLEKSGWGGRGPRNLETWSFVEDEKCLPSSKSVRKINNLIFFQFQVMLTDASRVLYNALDDKVFFKEVIVVVPQSWRDSRCQTQIQTPRGALVYRVRPFCCIHRTVVSLHHILFIFILKSVEDFKKNRALWNLFFLLIARYPAMQCFVSLENNV